MERLQILVKNMEEKKRIRQRVQKKRNELTVEEWAEKTRLIYEKVIFHPMFQEADTIYSYVDFRREAGTEKIMEAAWKMGKRVAVPRTEGETMDFYYIDSLEELSVGHFGVREPEPVHLAEGKEGLVLLPGSAFDMQRHRIGYGGGYYDRYLEKHPSLATMALAFSFQILDQIPYEPFDVRPEIIVTDTGIIEK